MPGSSRWAARSPRPGRPAAAAAPPPTSLPALADACLTPRGCALATPGEAGRRGGHVTFCHPRAEQVVGQLAAASIITDYRTPDRFRLGLSPLTTRFTDVWRAAGATRDILEQTR